MPVTTAAPSRLTLSELAPHTFQSEIRAMTTECDRMGGINLAQGVCDTPVPAVVEAAAMEAMRQGQNIYTRCDGNDRLRAAIARKQQRDYGLSYDAEREVMVTSGATAGLHVALMALVNPGDEVVLFEPFYGYHVNAIKSVRAVPVVVPLAQPGWQLDTDALRAAITPKTRAILLNTPANPSGKIFTRPELEQVAALCIERDLFLLTDEIYEYFVYEGAEHICPATLPGMRERTIVISGFSKTYSITGWRVGYMVADARWMPAMSHFHDLVYVCSPAPLQHGVAAGLEQLPPAYYKQIAMDHQAKRERLAAALRAAGMRPQVPPGAYYIMAESEHLPGKTAPEKARNLMARTGVASVAGTAFFRPGGGQNLLRFCFAKQDAELDEACRRLTQG